jgi:hypothetical protein
VPGLRQEIDGIVGNARRGAGLIERFGGEVRAAEARLKDVSREVRQGPLGMVAGKDPQRAIASVFGSDNPVAAMRELKNTVGRNPDAAKAFKASVADYFTDRVSGVNPAGVSEGTQSINFATLVKEFKKHEKALAEVFTPDEMNSLRRAQKVLAPLAQRAGQATVGSITAENTALSLRPLEVGLKFYYGMLKGGGVFRGVKLALETLKGTTAQDVERLIARSMFDQDLAGVLLTRNVKEAGTPAWSRELHKVMRRSMVAQDVVTDTEAGSTQ